MATNVKQMSAFWATLRLYDFWRYKAFVYLVVLTLGTVIALVLDVGFGIPQGRVLLYLAPLMAILFLVITAACVALRRAALAHSGEAARRASRFLVSSFDVYPEKGKTSDSLTGTMPELRELRDQMIAEFVRGINEAIAEQTKTAKRTSRRYSPTGRGRTDSRSFRFSR